jgi:hypothetical protein
MTPQACQARKVRPLADTSHGSAGFRMHRSTALDAVAEALEEAQSPKPVRSCTCVSTQRPGCQAGARAVCQRQPWQLSAASMWSAVARHAHQVWLGRATRERRTLPRPPALPGGWAGCCADAVQRPSRCCKAGCQPHGSFFWTNFTKCHPLSVLSDCSRGVVFPEIRSNKRTMVPGAPRCQGSAQPAATARARWASSTPSVGSVVRRAGGGERAAADGAVAAAAEPAHHGQPCSGHPARWAAPAHSSRRATRPWRTPTPVICAVLLLFWA